MVEIEWDGMTFAMHADFPDGILFIMEVKQVFTMRKYRDFKN
jgi:hypothetical protein